MIRLLIIYPVVSFITVELLSALLGGIIAGIFSLLAIKWQLSVERNLRKDETDKKINAILCALYHELKVSWELYMLNVGDLLEKEPGGSSFNYTISMTEHVYVIYDANAQFVGLIPDFLLRDKIIGTYINLKALKDAYLFHNQFIDSVAEAGAINSREGTPGTANVVLIKERVFKDSAAKLRHSHANAKESVSEILELLRTYVDKQSEDSS